MHRVFFDTNAGNERDGYILWFNQSRDDIAKIPFEEREGAVIKLYMTDELEIVAHLRRDAALDCWRGVPI